MHRTGVRVIAAAAIFGLLVTACTSSEGSPATTVSTESIVQSTTSGASAATTTSTTTDVASDLIQLPVATPIEGDAPVALAGPGDSRISYFSYAAVFDDFDGPPLPAGLAVHLHGCSLVGPGVIVYDLELDGDVAFPLEVVVSALVYGGDVGTGTYGHVLFEQGGRQLLVSSLPDQMLPYEEAGELASRNDRYGNQVERRPGFFREGSSCQLELGPDYSLRSEYADLVAVPIPLVPTAPRGTVESLAQAAYPDAGDADLLPIAIAYGEALRFYSNVWFIPEQPGYLDRMEERLDDDGCLELEFIYNEYSVLQSLNCPRVDAPAVRQVGSQWFATATDGRWIVTVSGDDETRVKETANSLQPYWHLFHRDVPLEPVDEKVIGRAEFEGGVILVTFGEQRCEGTCHSPETWFYVYKILETGLDEYAHYPGYGECLFVEEDEFVLAVAPDLGTIVAEGASGSSVLTVEDDNPWFFTDAPEGLFDVSVLDADGSEARCVDLLATDTRGGIGPFPGSDEPSPPPEVDRTIAAEACSSQPWYLTDYTDEDPLRQACVSSDFGQIATSLVIPNEMLAEPPQPEGLVCLIEQIGGSSGASCSQDGSHPIVSGHDGFMTFSVVVPEGTERVLGVTAAGAALIGIPHDDIVILWWLDSEGELRTVTAETPLGPVSLWPED